MWLVFFVVGIAFLFLGIYELKKYRTEPAEMPLKPQVREKKKVIPLNLTEETNKVKSEVDITSITPTPQTQQPNQMSLEERKRLWEEHWIVKKVKEQFENKQNTPSFAQHTQPAEQQPEQHIEEQHTPPEINPTSREQTPLEEKNPIKTIQQENIISYGETSQNNNINENLSEEKEENKKDKKEEEKEFNPFDMFG